jgi:hypothetical protein
MHASTGWQFELRSSVRTCVPAARLPVALLSFLVGALVAPAPVLAQGTLTNGLNHAGSISAPGEVDTWIFSANQSDAIVINIGEVATAPDPGFVPWIRVLNPSGVQIANTWGALAAQTQFSAPLTGTYTVLVSTADSGNDAVGSYTLTLARVPGTPGVSAGDEGGPMTNGENHEGALHVGDLDQWTFHAAKDETIAVNIGEVLTSEIDPGLVPWIRIIGPTGVQYGNTWGNLAAQLSFAAPLTGTYTVIVSTADIDAIGHYQITLARMPGQFVVPEDDEGGPMTNGENHQGVLHAGDFDQWSFEAGIGNWIGVNIGEVVTSEIDPGFVPWIRIIGPTGVQYGNTWHTLAAQLVFQAPLTGRYTVLVSTADSGNDATGTYRLTLARVPGEFIVPAQDEGGAMSVGVAHPGKIHPGDFDLWTFQAAQNATIVVSIGEVLQSPDPGFVPWIRLVAPNGSQIGNTWGTTAAQLSLVAPATGLYTIVVSRTDSANNNVGEYRLSVTGALSPERVVLGLGPKAGEGGWFAARRDLAANLVPSTWGRVPWPAYNAKGGGARVAAGDIDGDGLDELVVGLDPGSGGWFVVLDDAVHNYALLKWIQVQWGAYNAVNGEVWPAVGDLDGDGRAEIVAGLGARGHGWLEIFDDAAGGFAHLAFKQIAWPAYAASTGAVVYPAIGNVDGTGASEIIVGLGRGGGGWIEILRGTAGGYAHQAWTQVNWAAYNSANGTAFPAAGDVDGDGRAEIVVGLGTGSGGWFEVLQDAAGGFAHVAWLKTSWAVYNQQSGETHPAVGNIDGDAAAEIVVGLARFAGNGGWFETFDSQVSGFAGLGWRNVDWPAFRVSGGATYPAIGRFK